MIFSTASIIPLYWHLLKIQHHTPWSQLSTKMQANFVEWAMRAYKGRESLCFIYQLVSIYYLYHVQGEVTFGSDQMCATWHSGFNYSFSTPRTWLLGTSANALKQFRFICRTHELTPCSVHVSMVVFAETETVHASSTQIVRMSSHHSDTTTNNKTDVRCGLPVVPCLIGCPKDTMRGLA